ncbi:MAG: hypothetical protein NDI69_13525 [Bacteriovoracaceae bacterium]|nr:hypothetical protein [Bacteriovoracaceae bacterium]
MSKLKVPSGIPIFLTTKKSLELFDKEPAYPMGLIQNAKNVKHFRGLKECKVLKELISPESSQF